MLFRPVPGSFRAATPVIDQSHLLLTSTDGTRRGALGPARRLPGQCYAGTGFRLSLLECLARRRPLRDILVDIGVPNPSRRCDQNRFRGDSGPRPHAKDMPSAHAKNCLSLALRHWAVNGSQSAVSSRSFVAISEPQFTIYLLFGQFRTAVADNS